MEFLILSIISIISLISCNEAITFGFRTESNSGANSDDTFILSLFWGDEQFECAIEGNIKTKTLYTCDTEDLAQTSECVTDTPVIFYALQISKYDDPGTSNDDDTTLDTILVNDVEIEVDDEWVGDGSGGGQYSFYRYYDLGNDVDDFPTEIEGNTTKNLFIPECYSGMFAKGLTLGPENTYEGEKLDIGQTEFNEKFRNSGYYIIKRECSTCEADHQLIYYRRFTDIDTFDVYNSMKIWTSTDNILGTDFGLYSTFQDALDGTNEWTQCNYGSTSDPASESGAVGAFRDCGPNVLDYCDWTADESNTIWDTAAGLACGDSARFSIYTESFCESDDIGTFDWEVLTQDGLAAAGVAEPVVTTFAVDRSTLSLNITVELQYFGNAFADNEEEANFGVTYVLDFEDYDAHEDAINEPGTCQNRDEDAYTGKTFSDYFLYSEQPQDGNVGNSDYLAYPPPDPEVGEWDVYMKDGDECSTIVYSGSFTWNDLRECTSNVGSSLSTTTPPYQDSYTSISTDGNSLNLTGVFYINLVSPFWYDTDFNYYRVYQLLSQPFVISIQSAVNVLGSTGINLMTMSVVAVYKEDKETDFKLVLLTETAEYLELTRTSSDPFIFDGTDAGNTQITSGDFTVNNSPENSGCIGNKDYICTQLWELSISDIECISGVVGTDFSGNYALTFVPSCIDTGDNALNTYCANWLNDHPDIATKVVLNTDLTWVDNICKPKVFRVKFNAEMDFYRNDSFIGEVPDNYLYQAGESTIYVEITTAYPDDTLDVFNVELQSVHICTFDPLDAPSTDSSDLTTFGCFGDRDSEFDNYFFQIYDEGSGLVDHDFTLISDSSTATVRFSFTVPNEVARDRLYVQAKLEVELQEEGRRRNLLGRSRSRGPRAMANQLNHFVGQIGINHGQQEPKPYKEPQSPNNYPPQQPINNYPINNPHPVSPAVPTTPTTWTINLSSPYMLVLGGLLAVILAFNIAYMCYVNCCRDSSSSSRPRVSFERKKKGYSKVKAVDSEFDSEAQMIPEDQVSSD